MDNEVLAKNPNESQIKDNQCKFNSLLAELASYYRMPKEHAERIFGPLNWTLNKSGISEVYTTVDVFCPLGKEGEGKRIIICEYLGPNGLYTDKKGNHGSWHISEKELVV